MPTIAIFNPKGGVGKTMLSVNLAWAAATLSKRRVLLWDLDAQGASTFILGGKGKRHDAAGAVIYRDVEPEVLIQHTNVPRIDLLPADASIRSLDAIFSEIDKENRLKKLIAGFAQQYDLIILDCPPGLGSTADQVARAADLILAPIIPSTLARRSFHALREFLDRHHKGGPPVYPVFNMVDRRRKEHRETTDADPGCPAIPMAATVEQMGIRQLPLGAYAPRSPTARAVEKLWHTLEKLKHDGKKVL